MGRTILRVAVVAVFAVLSTGCLVSDGPTAPDTIAPIVFPADTGEGADDILQPSAPRDLRAVMSCGKVRLTWRHSDLMPGWFRIYVSRDGGDFQMIHCTDCCRCESCVNCGWTKLVYRVSAVNEQGVESELSEPVIFKRDLQQDPEVDVFRVAEGN